MILRDRFFNVCVRLEEIPLLLRSVQRLRFAVFNVVDRRSERAFGERHMIRFAIPPRFKPV